MKKILFILLLHCAFFLSAQATHIVGGELGFKYINDNTYNINLTLYFDAINGSAAALDEQVTLHVFRKNDNTFMRSVTLPLLTSDLLIYTNPDCAVAEELSTRRLYYEIELEMLTSEYNAQDGYYIIWERCCRNKIISNITFPEDAGQTFYLEFPPLTIRNSSPTLFAPPSDYACANKDFSFNFGGNDPDNDELKYSLRVPINGFSSPTNIIPTTANPAPYPRVNFIEGISIDNMIPGSPSFNVNQNGIVSVRASKAGLYVFAIVCEEFRNGVKIGEVQREFQLQVVDCFSIKATDFTPVNVFTPGTDGKNDTFTIPDLPLGDCHDSFISITIFNRWGKEVFHSEDYKFKWTGGEYPSGVYFYDIKYFSDHFSGSVSLVRNK